MTLSDLQEVLPVVIYLSLISLLSLSLNRYFCFCLIPYSNCWVCYGLASLLALVHDVMYVLHKVIPFSCYSFRIHITFYGFFSLTPCPLEQTLFPLHILTTVYHNVWKTSWQSVCHCWWMFLFLLFWIHLQCKRIVYLGVFVCLFKFVVVCPSESPRAKSG
jgi:hypothetical protein